MQRPIDAKEAIEELMSDSCYECSWGSDNPLSCDCDCTYREAIRMAINALTDAESVRHGHWEWTDDPRTGDFVCSNCLDHNIVRSRYCPICGAIMDEVENNERDSN